METGYRRGPYEVKLPKHIIERFRVEYLGKPVFSTEFGPGIAANPELRFLINLLKLGEVVVEWKDDKQQRWESVHEVVVT